MKKCLKCGGSNPSENLVCNHCGYSFSGKNSELIDSNGKKYLSGALLLAIFLIFLIAVGVLFYAFSYSKDDNYVVPEVNHSYYTCDMLCDGVYTSNKDKCICGNGNIYYEGSGVVYYESSEYSNDAYYRCKVYCDDLVYKYDDESCTCDSGKKVDKYGNDYYANTGNVYDVLDNWENNILMGNNITTVLCNSYFFDDCESLRKTVRDINDLYGTNVYYMNVNSLSNNQKNMVFNRFDIGITDSKENYPYIFTMKDTMLYDSKIGIYSKNDIIDYLKLR